MGRLGRAPATRKDASRMPPPSVSVVVPVYNSSATLPELVARLSAVLGEVTAEYEVVLVNDGSRDNSWSEIEAMATIDTHLCAINLAHNFGQHNAVLAGVRAAKYDVIVTLDDDLQHPPEAIPELLAALTPEYDLVYGTPRAQRHSPWRNAAAVSVKSTLKLVGGWGNATNVTDFRAFRTELRDSFATYDAPSIAFDVLLAWATESIAYVPVEHAPRKVGRSNYRLSTLAEYAATMATSYSTRPIRLAAFVGTFLSVAGFCGIAGVLINDLVSGDSVTSVGLLIALIVFFGGLQLAAIGVVGEYVARAHFRTLSKPTYVVRSVVRHTPRERDDRTPAERRSETVGTNLET